MTNLPAELAAFASLLDAQPEPVRAAFAYCLALAPDGSLWVGTPIGAYHYAPAE